MDVPLVATRALAKHFGPVAAVQDLSFEIGPGEIFGFLGPNGSGKSTTIRMLLDLVRPSSGAAYLFGQNVVDRPELRTQLGYLAADSWFPSRRRVHAFLDDLDGLRGEVGAHRERLMERFDVDPTRRLGDLSTGQLQKVGIVAAFMHRPRVALLDEPSRGLDPVVQLELRDLLREQRELGVAILLSSHSLAEVSDVVDRVGILRTGSFRVVASLDELRDAAPLMLAVHFVAAPDALALEQLRFLDATEVDGRRVTLRIRGDIGAALNEVAALGPIERFQTTDAGLEQLFLSYYRGGSDAAPLATDFLVGS